MECPNCHGIGKIYLFMPPRNGKFPPCPICQGAGELPANIKYDPERGKHLQAERMGKDMTLREWCKLTGEDAQERVERERGMFRER